MSRKIGKIWKADSAQTIQSHVFGCFKGKAQSAFSLIEVMISLGLLGITFAGYMKFSANSSAGLITVSEKTDLLMLRKFITTQFSCEKTLAASSKREGGRLTYVNCPAGIAGRSIDIYSKDRDGKIMFAKDGSLFGVYKDSLGKDQGGYKVVGVCDGNGSVPDVGSPVKVPSFRFFASKADNPFPLQINSVLKFSPGWSDLLDGGEIECALPDDPGLPVDTKCTAMFVSRPGGVPTEEVPGPYFRSNGDPWITGGHGASLVIRAYREQDLAISSTEGRPTTWRMKWMNKNPDDTIGDPVYGRLVEDGFATPVASPSFLVPANLTLMNPSQPMSNCTQGGVITTAAPAYNQVPACSFWEQKVEFNQMSNPPDWYAAPLDLIIEGLDSSQNVLTSCSTKMQLISPLVLTWPRNADTPEDLDFHPTTTKFDIAASGKRVNSGWIGGFSAFLVLDRNRNGRIDNGSELFGDATAIGRSTASKAARHPHGFAALAEFDDNQDMFIDQQDEVYTNLRLWFDEDSDGESQPWELHGLKDFEVKKIALRFKPVDKQPKEANMLTKFAYESSFYGPEICGPAGCRIYDIYFTMAHPRDAE